MTILRGQLPPDDPDHAEVSKFIEYLGLVAQAQLAGMPRGEAERHFYETVYAARPDPKGGAK